MLEIHRTLKGAVNLDINKTFFSFLAMEFETSIFEPFARIGMSNARKGKSGDQDYWARQGVQIFNRNFPMLPFMSRLHMKVVLPIRRYSLLCMCNVR